MIPKRCLTLVLVCFILAIAAQPYAPAVLAGGAGTGPGGVGSTDGTGTLLLWVKADNGTGQITDNSPVSSWADQAGHSLNLVQGTSANQPTFQSDGSATLNGNPVVRFDGNDVLISNTTLSFDTYTIFAVFLSTVNGRYIYEHGTVGAGGSVPGTFLANSNNCTFFTRQMNGGGASAKDLFSGWAADGVIRITALRFDGTHIGHALAINSTNQALTTCLTHSFDPPGGLVTGNVSLGSNSTLLAPMQGDVAEFVVYSVALNSAEQTLVEDYLGAKYDIVTSADCYGGDLPGNGDYDLDMAGIRQIGASTHNQGNSAGLQITNVSFLDGSGDCLTWGHKTAVNDNSTSNLGVGIEQRWERVWYLDRTGGIGPGDNVTMRFDFSDAGMNGNGAMPGVSSNYRLLQLNGATYDPVVGVTATVVGDGVEFGVDINNIVDGVYTLGTTNSEDSPTVVQISASGVTQFSHNWLWFMVGGLLLSLRLLWFSRRR